MIKEQIEEALDGAALVAIVGLGFVFDVLTGVQDRLAGWVDRDRSD